MHSAPTFIGVRLLAISSSSHQPTAFRPDAMTGIPNVDAQGHVTGDDKIDTIQ